MDAASQAYFDGLRERHFPARLNYLQAHLTLFHALPGEELAAIRRLTDGGFGATGVVVGLRSLGRGVAFRIECADLVAKRGALAVEWREFLTAQDSQKWMPHVTVQNKVEAAVARDLLVKLSAEFAAWEIQFTGLDLWHYRGGPWERA